MKSILPRLLGSTLNALGYVLPRLAAKKGFELFCTARPAPVKDYHLEFFNTAEQHSFKWKSYIIQTYKWGDGPRKILFLHGWQSHSFRWKKYIDSYPKDQYTIYALDAPAHGLSSGKLITLPLYAEIVVHFIEEIAPLHAVIAHSFGGFALLYAMFEKPTLEINRIVLMGVPGEAIDFIRFYQRALGVNDRTLNLMIDHFEQKLHHKPEFYSTLRFAPQSTQRGLIIHDRNDAEAPYKYAERLHEAWAGSQIITTTDLGHNLKPPKVMGWVREFVEQP